MLKVYSKPVWLRHSSLHLVTATIVLHFSVSYKLIRKGLVSGLKIAPPFTPPFFWKHK